MNYIYEKDGEYRIWNRDSLSEIRPWLFLGDAEHASNKTQLLNIGITHILNVSDDIKSQHKETFKIYKLGVKDGGKDEGITRVFEAACDFLNEVRDSGGKVLVHCRHGINRSPTIVIAYLMIEYNMSFEKAVTFVWEKRPIIRPFSDNMGALDNLEKKMKETGLLESEKKED